MPTTLYLVRHAIAEDYNAQGDAERALTAEGEAKMRRAAAGIASLGVRPDLVLTSPLRRAQQTARIVCEVLAPRLEPVICNELAPGHSARQVLHVLDRRRAAGEIVLVGHEPDMGRLASALLTGSADAAAFTFKKGGLAAIELLSFDADERGALGYFLTPKQLRMLGEH